MKKIILVCSLLLASYANAIEQKIVCTPTIGDGHINYSQQDAAGLNRISSIEVTLKSFEYDITIELFGTGGVGDTKAQVKHKLNWSSSFGDKLMIYHINNAQHTLEKPFIRFEMENMNEEKPFLAALTFSAVKDAGKYKAIMNSRYTCELKK